MIKRIRCRLFHRKYHSHGVVEKGFRGVHAVAVLIYHCKCSKCGRHWREYVGYGKHAIVSGTENGR